MFKAAAYTDDLMKRRGSGVEKKSKPVLTMFASWTNCELALAPPVGSSWGEKARIVIVTERDNYALKGSKEQLVIII